MSPDVLRLFERLDKEAESAGYHLNPDRSFTLGLVEGLLVNERRYGYWACPCRLASGVREEDLDIICPCDYRDPDLADFGVCFCALYVSQEVLDGKKKPARIPERRPPDEERAARAMDARNAPTPGAPEKPLPAALPYPVWRCRVCGYLCARGTPPETCPICRAKRDRFERFL